MGPGDMVKWLFYTTAGGGIVEHDLAIADVAKVVDLPEDGGTGPVFRGTD